MAKRQTAESGTDRPETGTSGATAKDPAALLDMVERLKRKLDDQQARIDALARGREEGMEQVASLRSELKIVASERDRLRRELTDIEGMQTETRAFDDSMTELAAAAAATEAPTIDELMATVGRSDDTAAGPSHSTLPVEEGGEAEAYQEMLPPEAIVLGSNHQRGWGKSVRFVVMKRDGEAVRFLLEQELVTIGRSDSADIQIDGDFISRIHARVLRIGRDSVIEDAGSRNGIWVNGRPVERHVLGHGDLIRIGSHSLRFVDAGESQG